MKSAVLQQGIVLCKFCQQRDGLRYEAAVDPGSCYVCEGMMTGLKSLADEILIKLKEFEFESFLVGASVPQSILDREDELRSRLKIKGRDGIKSQITKVLSKRVKQHTGKSVNYSRPDVTILASMVDRQITVNPRIDMAQWKLHKACSRFAAEELGVQCMQWTRLRAVQLQRQIRLQYSSENYRFSCQEI